MVLFAYVDTCVFTDILRCYDSKTMSLNMKPLNFLNRVMIEKLTQVLYNNNGNIIVSSFVFIELINKFDEIFKNDDFSIERLKALLKQTPEWLIIEDINNSVVKASISVPSYIDADGISMDDTIHIATAISRGDEMYFLTTDKILNKLKMPKIHFIS